MAAAGTTLLVLDFSGTLSVAAARFAAPDRLRSELEHAGLADLGVDSPAVFFDELINPTWAEGSTTGRGYAAVLTDALHTLLSGREPPVAAHAVRDRAEAFAARYLAASTIAPEWGRWLRRIVGVPDVAVVIATDHYADATGHIIDQLGRLGIRAVPLPPGAGRAQPRVMVANSADLGRHKSDPAFWAAVRHGVDRRIVRVVLLDDFGANEVDADAYAAREAVRRRRDTAVALLRSAFGTDVVVRDFVLDAGAGPPELRRLVERVGRSTMRLLSAAS